MQFCVWWGQEGCFMATFEHPSLKIILKHYLKCLRILFKTIQVIKEHDKEYNFKNYSKMYLSLFAWHDFLSSVVSSMELPPPRQPWGRRHHYRWHYRLLDFWVTSTLLHLATQMTAGTRSNTRTGSCSSPTNIPGYGAVTPPVKSPGAVKSPCARCHQCCRS